MRWLTLPSILWVAAAVLPSACGNDPKVVEKIVEVPVSVERIVEVEVEKVVQVEVPFDPVPLRGGDDRTQGIGLLGVRLRPATWCGLQPRYPRPLRS